MRVKLVLAYDGHAYRGSQIQPNVPTIQEELERALRTIRAYSGRTTFAGRTDAGVHAAGQVVSCDVSWDRELERLSHGLNSVLPHDIRVLECDQVAPDFNARFDAHSREYRYRVSEQRVLHPLQARYVWASATPIDQQVAARVAGMFEGTHRFGSFASAGFSRRMEQPDLARTIQTCIWAIISDPLFPGPTDRPVHELRIRGDGFLPQMVRNITSAIVEVASGKKPPEWIEFLLVSGDRRLLGPPAPPHGLVLWNVEYAGNLDALNGNKG